MNPPDFSGYNPGTHPHGKHNDGAYFQIVPHRSVREYRGQKGSEHNGTILPWSVLDSLGETLPRGLPDMYEVIGEIFHPDGRHYLDFGVTTAYIEAMTDHVWDGEKHRLRIYCKKCQTYDGKHSRGCQG